MPKKVTWDDFQKGKDVQDVGSFIRNGADYGSFRSEFHKEQRNRKWGILGAFSCSSVQIWEHAETDRKVKGNKNGLDPTVELP